MGRSIELTMTKRIAVDMEVSEEEIEKLQNGEVPEWIQKIMDNQNWTDGWQDYAVWDIDNEEQLVDWSD